MEHWVDEVIPAAIEEVSRHAGGRPVHLVGWSIGGTFALLTAADRPELPIASLTTIGSPIDVTQVPLVAPIRPFLGLAGDRAGLVTQAYRLMGGAPKPLVRRAFQLTGFNKLVTKPIAIARNLDDADYLAQIEAVDRFTANMIAYPGRTFGQLYHRLLKGNALVDGTFDLDDRTLSVADIEVPILVFAGANDGIAPVASVKASVPLLTGSREVRFEIVPGGHLGMLTGRKARSSTWLLLDAWIDEWTVAEEPAPHPRRTAKRPAAATRTTKKTTKKTAKKAATPAKKAPARKTATTKPVRKPVKKAATPAAAPVTEPADDGATIGVNPERRYGSAGSRALRR